MNEAYEVLTYLLYGDGKWMTRTESTGGDLVLQWTMILGALWMSHEYMVIALTSNAIAKGAKPSVFKNYQIALRNVFFTSATLHLLTAVVAWWFTPYWLIAFLYFYNAMSARWLNRTKLDAQQFKEVVSSLDMVNQNEFLRDEINQLRSRAETLLVRRSAQDEFFYNQQILRQLYSPPEGVERDQSDEIAPPSSEQK
jgi:hypothetical protein